MKFYQIIASVTLCTMYSATIIGVAEETGLPRLGVDVPGLIEQFRGEGDIYYKETFYAKPYPKDWKEQFNITGKYLASVGGELTVPRTITGELLVFLFSLYRGVIDKLSSSYTSIKSPQYIGMISRVNFLNIVGGVPILRDRGTYYRSEVRDLSSMELRIASKGKGRDLILEDPYFTEDYFMNPKKERKGRIYELEDGEVKIYLSEMDFKSKNEMSSLPTTKNITAFDVSDDGKIIITGGRDGIRKWELQEAEEVEKTFEKLYK